METTIERTEAAATVFDDGSSIVRTASLAWTRWAMPGTWFKLLHLDDEAPSFTILLKVDAGTEAGLHKHFGAAHAFTLEGEWGYEHGTVRAGDYIREAGGVTHAPFTGPQGTVMFATVKGPLAAVDASGQVVAVVDNDWHFAAAKANGAAGHVRRGGPARISPA